MYNYNNTPYYNPYAPSYSGNSHYQTQNNNMMAQQPTYTPLVFVNGVEGAKAYIVQPNSTIYLRDSDSDKLFIKYCDAQGRSTLRTYALVELDEQGNKKVAAPIQEIDPEQFVTKESFRAVETKLNKLQSAVDKLNNKKAGE